MRIDTWPLTGASPGTRREVTAYCYGGAGTGPKVYLQAGLHADEMPGVLVLQHLMGLLDQAEAAGEINGEVVVVPMANPIGLGQWAFQRPQGRQEFDSLHNFNRGYPELAKLAGDALEGVLGDDGAENVHAIRRAFRAALAAERPGTDAEEQKIALLSWSCDADYVLDLHCDHFAVLHLYASKARPEVTSLLCKSVGAHLALIADVSGGNAFDEAHTVPWTRLRERFPGKPIPAGCFSTTLEYRGQFDVTDDLASADAGHLMTFLQAVGAVAGPGVPAHADAVHLPLEGTLEVFAPQGGVVTWGVQVGAQVAEGQVIAHVTDPVSRRRMEVKAPVAGLLFRQELWRPCLRGQSLAHIAGENGVRSGDLLSD